ncbi:MAG: DUF4169 family protein [Sphingobium sp.]|uniref:DUF4169 family protein n=1 Tax=Sphingobium sp. TaxID=1912891 RepID=UPI0029A1DEFE|nr:DUF4169 family protein [Sphingobium sp.]MDX3911211.1 DUF4169 family protein [Sphingobium sp.]
MAEIVNLRNVRKARKREEAERTAAENRARFGRTKAQRLTQEAETGRQDRALDGAKREDPSL